MRDAVCRFSKSSRGATAIEYGVIAAGIALVIAAAVALMGENVSSVLDGLSETVNPAEPSTNVPEPEPQTIIRDRGNMVVVPR